MRVVPCLLQENWGLVLDLATDTAPAPQKGSSAQMAADAKLQAAHVRRHAVNVMDDVYRNGLAPPWEAIPHLVAATTDPNRWLHPGLLCFQHQCEHA